MKPGQIVGPIILVGLGVLFLLNNLGWGFSIGYLIRTFWPLILIAIGAVHLAAGLTGRGSAHSNFIGAIIMVSLGVLFQLNNLGWHLPVGYFFRTWWPLILVAVGLFQIGGALTGRGSLAGGVILLTIGSLFTLDRTLGLSFRDTWPVVLIAVGAIGLLRAILGPVAFADRFRGGLHR